MTQTVNDDATVAYMADFRAFLDLQRPHIRAVTYKWSHFPSCSKARRLERANGGLNRFDWMLALSEYLMCRLYSTEAEAATYWTALFREPRPKSLKNAVALIERGRCNSFVEAARS